LNRVYSIGNVWQTGQLMIMCKFMWHGVHIAKCHIMSACGCIHHVSSSGSLWTVTKCSEWLVMWTWGTEFCSNAWSVPGYQSLECDTHKHNFDVLTSNISFMRVPNTEKCDVTASNGTHQSANSRRGHMT
jgi:hypothetical protein